jgi:hypothetical protein
VVIAALGIGYQELGDLLGLDFLNVGGALGVGDGGGVDGHGYTG